MKLNEINAALDRLAEAQGLTGMPVATQRLVVLMGGMVDGESPLIVESFAIFLRTNASAMADDMGISEGPLEAIADQLAHLALDGYDQD